MASTVLAALSPPWSNPRPAIPEVNGTPHGATATPVRDDQGNASEIHPAFVDVTEVYGIGFRHHNGGLGDKHLPETLGSGVAWLDYDQDGALDLYFVDSGTLGSAETKRSATAGGAGRRARPAGPAGATALDAASPAPGRNALYRSENSGYSVASSAGAADPGYGMGVSIADYDADGWPDIFVTNFGPNALYRNNGDGTFSDVTASAGLDEPLWSVGSSWGDLDDDGFPELYIANYVSYDPDDQIYCGDLGTDVRSYCHIDLFDGVDDSLFHNNGDGRFVEISAEAGLVDAGKGLGVIMADLDDDGRLDVYVANDTDQNFLYLNRGQLRLQEVGLISGVGYGEDGSPQAGMGTTVGDLDGDGSLEIVVTNFAFEPANLYRLAAPGIYVDDTYSLGLGEASLPTLGFGVISSDLDGDGDLDLVLANGHVLDNVDEIKDNSTYPQPNQLFINHLALLRPSADAAGEQIRVADPEAYPRSASTPGSPGPWRPPTDLLTLAPATAGEPLGRARVSRGLAVGDTDRDGWPDLVVTNSNGPAELLRNSTDSGSNRLVLRLRGRTVNRGALGARVWVTPYLALEPAAYGYPQLLQITSASSYASQNAADLYLGLGEAQTARVDIHWPGGAREALVVGAGQAVLIAEGRGIIATRALQPHRIQ